MIGWNSQLELNGQRRRGGTLAPSNTARRVVFCACLLCAIPTRADTDSATNAPAISAPEPRPVTAREFYNAGTRKLSEGKLSDAESFLQASLTRQEARLQPAALYNLGHVRFNQGSEELKKANESKDSAMRSASLAQQSDLAARRAESALASGDMQKMIEAYMAGRGVRKELRAATEAFVKALELYGKTLRKWERSRGDFRSAVELNPTDTNAVRNAEIVDEAIAKLVDQLRQMQQAMKPMSGPGGRLQDLMQQLKGKIPKELMPPGAEGDEDEDSDIFMEALRGLKEGPSRTGDEMEKGLSPEEAGNMLDGLRAGEGRRLPMGQGEQGQPKDRKGKTW